MSDNDEFDWLSGLAIVMFTFTFLIHGFTVHLLWILDDKKVSQRLLLLNLCVTEMFLSIGNITFNSVKLSSTTKDDEKTVAFRVIELLHWVGLWLVYLLLMMALMVDRYLRMKLALRYRRICTRKKLLCTLAVIWMLAIIAVIINAALHFEIKYDFVSASFNYVFPVMDTLVTLITISVYAYLVVTLRQRHTAQRTREPKIVIPVCIVATFVVFLYIPDMIVLILRNPSLIHFLYPLFSVGMSLDAIICLYMNEHMRALTAKKIFRASAERVAEIRKMSSERNHESVKRMSEMKTPNLSVQNLPVHTAVKLPVQTAYTNPPICQEETNQSFEHNPDIITSCEGEEPKT